MDAQTTESRKMDEWRAKPNVLDFETSRGVRFECVLHVGDVGVWRDPRRIDRATRKHDGAGDFRVCWSERRPAPDNRAVAKQAAQQA